MAICVLGRIESEPIMLCLPFAGLGSLDRYLQSNIVLNSLKLREMIHIAIQVASAFCYLRDLGVVHRDLAARNV